MKSSEKRLLILLAVLVAVSLPYIFSLFSTSEELDDLGLELQSSQRVQALTIDRDQLPVIDLSSLEQSQAEFTGSGRNLFAFGSGASIPTSSEDFDDEEVDSDEDEDAHALPTTVVETANNRANTNSRQKLSGYEYLGFHEKPNAKTAVFTYRNKTYFGKKGQTINQAFVIKEIKGGSVRIQVLDGDFEQQLKLKSPTGNSPGGRK